VTNHADSPGLAVRAILRIHDSARGRALTPNQAEDLAEARQLLAGTLDAPGVDEYVRRAGALILEAPTPDAQHRLARELVRYLDRRDTIAASDPWRADMEPRIERAPNGPKDTKQMGVTERIYNKIGVDYRSILTSTSTSALATRQDWREFSEYLYPASAALRSGIRVIDIDATSVKIPAGTALATGAWLAEGATAVASDMGVTSYTVTPARITVFSEFSNEVLEDASFPAMDTINTALFESLATKLDTAIFQGDGTSNVPQGMLNLPSSGTVTGGTPADLGYFVQGIEGAYNANADVKAWAMNGDAWGAIAGLKIGGTASYDNRPLIAQDVSSGGAAIAGAILGRPVFVTSNISTTGSTATKVFGYDPAQVWLVRRRDFQLTVDPFSKAEQGITRLVLEGRFGLAFPQPKAVRVITPIVVS
jgi:HK97 family phage major capsid protein